MGTPWEVLFDTSEQKAKAALRPPDILFQEIIRDTNLSLRQ